VGWEELLVTGELLMEEVKRQQHDFGTSRSKYLHYYLIYLLLRSGIDHQFPGQLDSTLQSMFSQLPRAGPAIPQGAITATCGLTWMRNSPGAQYLSAAEKYPLPMAT
jgi:hypothetical protein